MGAYRLAVARDQGLPGILPGVPHEQCPSSMMGASRAYISSPHRDGRMGMPPMAGMSESILAHLVKARFAVLSAGVLLDLGAAEACMVMVPADDLHGTLPPADGAENNGIGVVIAAAKQLHTSAVAMAHKAELQARMAARQVLEQQQAQLQLQQMPSEQQTQPPARQSQHQQQQKRRALDDQVQQRVLIEHRQQQRQHKPVSKPHVLRCKMQQLQRSAKMDWTSMGGSVFLTKPFYRPPGIKLADRV